MLRLEIYTTKCGLYSEQDESYIFCTCISAGPRLLHRPAMFVLQNNKTEKFNYKLQTIFLN